MLFIALILVYQVIAFFRDLSTWVSIPPRAHKKRRAYKGRLINAVFSVVFMVLLVVLAWYYKPHYLEIINFDWAVILSAKLMIIFFGMPSFYCECPGTCICTKSYYDY